MNACTISNMVPQSQNSNDRVSVSNLFNLLRQTFWFEVKFYPSIIKGKLWTQQTNTQMSTVKLKHGSRLDVKEINIIAARILAKK